MTEVKLKATLVENFIETGDALDELEKEFATVVMSMKEDADFNWEKITIEIENDFEHEEEEEEEESD
jgi:hypothetical protein